jgi:hypothetical protein
MRLKNFIICLQLVGKQEILSRDGWSVYKDSETTEKNEQKKASLKTGFELLLSFNEKNMNLINKHQHELLPLLYQKDHSCS